MGKSGRSYANSFQMQGTDTSQFAGQFHAGWPMDFG